MQAVIRRLARPLAAPSANLANQLSPTSAEHVLNQLDKLVGTQEIFREIIILASLVV